MASKRLQKELLEMEKDSLYSVMLGDGDDLSLWIVQIPGPVSLSFLFCFNIPRN